MTLSDFVKPRKEFTSFFMADVNSVKEYVRLCEEWIDTLHELLDKKKDNYEKIFLVAVSRKMPSIIKVLRKHYPENTKFFDDYQFVTEHVLPYILNDFIKDKHHVVIVDDAMYYGSTISRIARYINDITGDVPDILPIAINSLIGNYSYANIIPELNTDRVSEERRNTIRERNIPFFTTQNAERIIKLRQPIDMEFPILHYKVSNGIKPKDNIEKKLSEIFDDCVVYHIAHQVKENAKWEDVLNYCVLPKKRTQYDSWNKDFSKLRFFVSDIDIRVVSYAPGIMTPELLKEEKPLFSDPNIQGLWRGVREYAVGKWPSDKFESSVYNLTRDYYWMQCDRSKVIWVNYLASYLYLLKQKERLSKAISSLFGDEVLKSAEFVEDDTRQLLPPSLVKTTTRLLNQYYQDYRGEDSVFYSLKSAAAANQVLIPEKCKEKYWKSTYSGLQKCQTVKEALSLVFSNIQLVLNDGELSGDPTQRSEYLRFGFTYSALEDLLSFPLGVENLWYHIHQWLDKNIDEATVKPYYERLQINGMTYWVRMFRSGENEYSFTKMRRICELIISGLRERKKGHYVERESVEDLLTIMWEDPCNIIGHTYKWDSFIEKRDGLSYSFNYEDDKLMGIDEDDRKNNYLDFLIKQNLLSDLVIENEVPRVSSIQNGDRYTIVTPFEEKQKRAILDYVDAYYLCKNVHKWPFVINNFFPCEEEDLEVTTKELLDWRDNFVRVLSDLSNDGFDVFYKLNEELNEIIWKTIKDKIDLSENDEIKIRKEILDFLKFDLACYPDFKDKVMAAAVVRNVYKRLFIQSNGDREAVRQSVESNLSNIEGEEENKKVILDFVDKNEEEQSLPDNRRRVKDALIAILNNKVK